MLTATFAQIIEARIGLEPLMAAKLPVKAKYAVGKLAHACDMAIREFQAASARICRDRGCTIEKDGDRSRFVHDDPEVLDAAQREVDELRQCETGLNALPLDLEQFKDADIEGPAFYGLEWAMKITEADKK